MKKTTPQKLSNRLARYSALSLAIAGVTDSSGQIIYTDVDPDINVTTDGFYYIDMDNDGTGTDPTMNESGDADEFLIRLQILTSSNFLVAAPLLNTASMLGLDAGLHYPFALNSSYVISSGNLNWQSYNLGFVKWMNFNSCYPSATSTVNSYWCNTNGSDINDKFLGLRFDIGGEIHYGWARLDASTTLTSGGFTIKDYAYNPIPESAGPTHSIMAGEGIPTAGIKEDVFNGVKIVALNKSIALFNLPQQTNYRLFSITGQSVLDGKISDNTHVIEANNLASGIYIIELQDANNKAVMRKKIVL